MKVGDLTVSSQVTGVGTSSEGDFGANQWLVDELFQQYKVDKNFRRQGVVAGDGAVSAQNAGSTAQKADAQQPSPSVTKPPTQPVRVAKTTAKPASEAPIPAQPVAKKADADVEDETEDKVTPLRGLQKTLTRNVSISRSRFRPRRACARSPRS